MDEAQPQPNPNQGSFNRADAKGEIARILDDHSGKTLEELRAEELEFGMRVSALNEMDKTVENMERQFDTSVADDSSPRPGTNGHVDQDAERKRLFDKSKED